ncbi:MAG: DUF1588 domain-containing protein [Sandaracinus sp.]
MPLRRRALVALTALGVLGACSDPPPAGPPAGDGGVPAPDVGPPACGPTSEVIQFFGTNCASNGACHVPNAQYPDLTASGLPALVSGMSRRLPSEHLVVAGDPSASFLYRKITNTQGATGGSMMPIGSGEPLPDVSVVEAWIRAGAPTDCDMPPPTEVPYDPNGLDQDALFTCVTPTSSSVARVRRIERLQWTHAVGESRGSPADQNPFSAPAGRYTTFSDGVTIDPDTLELFMLGLPNGLAPFTDEHGGAYYTPPRTIDCAYNDARPSDACIDLYVDQLLTRGVLFRHPTADEHARLRQVFVDALARESGGPGNRGTGERGITLDQVASSAWLMTGALFRPELGEPVPGDTLGRRRLTDDELALALAGVLGTHAPGQLGGILADVRAAADDGSIQSEATLRALLVAHRGGMDASRADLAGDIDSRDIPHRGAYWIAPRLADFFREYLGYGPAVTVFKDRPAATSRWAGTEHVDTSFANLQSGFYGYESTLVGQMDDTIARMVVESETDGADVFRTMLTTRTWFLASTTAGIDLTRTCTSNGDCGSGGDCLESAGGYCSTGSVFKSTVNTQRVYGIDANVPPDGQWVEMPEGERAGLLTHPAWLGAHGGNFEDDPSAVQRGRWIREHLFCETVPPLGLVRVNAVLPEHDASLRARDRIHQGIETSAESATCMSCHAQMNSLGLPFEIYNHAGFLRESDHGIAPDGHSTIDNLPDAALNGDVEDAVELTQMFASSAYARRCFIRHVFRYFMGRDETMADACLLASLEASFAGGSIYALIETLVTSDAFLYRTIEGGAP